MATIEQVLFRLKGVKRSGDHYTAFCPAHENKKTQALSVSEGAGGKVLFKCFSKDCSFESIAAALGFEPRELMGPSDITPIREPVTLAKLAEKTGLPQQFLERLGWRNTRSGTAVAIPYRDAQGAHLYSKLRVSLAGGPKYKFAGQGTKQTVYGLRSLRHFRQKHNRLFLVEGETDTATLWYAKLPALGIPGSNAVATTLTKRHVEGFQEVYAVQENDSAGKAFVQRLGDHLAELEYDGIYKVLHLPEDVKDANDLFRQDPEGFYREFLNLAHEAADWSHETDSQRLICFADMGEPVVPQFLWEPYIPRGEVVLMAGRPGIGKSLATVAIAATLTRGFALPSTNGHQTAAPQKTLFMAGEDDPHAQILPRAIEAGADKSLLFAVNQQAWGVDLWQEECLKDLAREVRSRKIDLVIIDPIQAWVSHPGFSINDQMHVRRVMKGLSNIVAHDTGATVLVVAHDRKAEVATAIDAVLGSRDLTAAVRSVLMLFAHPTKGDGWGVLSHAKHNYSAAGKTLSYRVEAESGRPRLLWDRALDVTAEDLVAEKQVGADLAAREEAAEILEGLLEETYRVSTREAYKMAREHGLHPSTMRRARKDLGLGYQRVGNAHYWTAPAGDREPVEDDEASEVPF